MSDDGSIQQQTFWKKCSSCKKEIPFGATYFLCSVSTCRHERTGLRFCSVACWDAHLGYANHRSSYAEEAKAPISNQSFATAPSIIPATPREPQKKIVESKTLPSPTDTPQATSVSSGKLPTTDTLVVVSKVKQLIREQSGFNTSECCIEALTRRVIEEALSGIEHARTAGRKTVMGRDILKFSQKP